MHERLSLEPRWYLGAYALYFSLLTPVVCQAYESDRELAVRMVTALQKRLTLDVDLAMQTYAARREQDLEYMADELAREGRRLARDVLRRPLPSPATGSDVSSRRAFSSRSRLRDRRGPGAGRAVGC